MKFQKFDLSKMSQTMNQMNRKLNEAKAKLPFAAVLEKPSVAHLSQSIDQNLNLLLTNTDFLRAASVVINLNSYRRKWTRAAVRRVLTSLELPVRNDQEKMLALLEQLNNRLEDLEAAAKQPPAADNDDLISQKKKLDVVGRFHVPS